MTEAGCDCVKVEVDRRLADAVAAMSRASIPVMAHLGLRPQSIQQIGGYRCQGKTAQDGLRILEDARIMEEAGAVALLLEAVSNEVAQLVTQRTELPVIGCLSGPHCDGQVLVMHDILGYPAAHRPSAVKTYADLGAVLTDAFSRYAADIRTAAYPTERHGKPMPPEELTKLRAAIE